MYTPLHLPMGWIPLFFTQLPTIDRRARPSGTHNRRKVSELRTRKKSDIKISILTHAVLADKLSEEDAELKLIGALFVMESFDPKFGKKGLERHAD